MIDDRLFASAVFLSSLTPLLSFRAVTRNPEKYKGQTKSVWPLSYVDSGSEAGMT